MLHCRLIVVSDHSDYVYACQPRCQMTSGSASALVLPLLQPSWNGDFRSKYGIQILTHDAVVFICVADI